MGKQLVVDIGDWVFTKNGKLVEITGDDMPNLKYEDIKRKATDEECPLFKFNMRMHKNLNRKDFWNPMCKKYPHSVVLFYDWLGEYKRHHICWGKIFKKGVEFEDVPFEIQFGIIIEFLSRKVPLSFLPDMDNWGDRKELVNNLIWAFYMNEKEHNDGFKKN